MLVVTFDVWPGGDHARTKTLGRIEIENVGGTDRLGTYRVRVFRAGRLWREGEVAGFPRTLLGPWDLLLRGLVALLRARNVSASRDALAREPFGGTTMDSVDAPSSSPELLAAAPSSSTSTARMHAVAARGGGR